MLLEHTDIFHIINQMSKTFTIERLCCYGPNYVF